MHDLLAAYADAIVFTSVMHDREQQSLCLLKMWVRAAFAQKLVFTSVMRLRVSKLLKNHTTTIAYRQNREAPADFLPIKLCNSSCVHKRHAFTSMVLEEAPGRSFLC